MATASSIAGTFGSLIGKVYIVTGANNGIGKECLRALYCAGATVIMAARPGEKSRKALEDIAAAKVLDGRGNGIHHIELDLGSPESVKSCAEQFLALKLPLHGLVNNAGINGVKTWGEHTPGVETQFAVNFLGHFQLTALLHEKLAATEGARVVILSSESHRRVLESDFNVASELPPQEERYDSLHAYAFSNLCRLLWAQELAQRVSYPVVCLHPGVIGGTGMLQHMTWRDMFRQVFLALKWELKPLLAGMNVERGALVQTWAAVAPVVDLRKISGSYLIGDPGHKLGEPQDPSALAKDDMLGKQVYQYAENFFSEKR
ncbi:hypothetical protein CYMTET_8886 [Cymbomonas tetramitiformis]|uniref:Uncharacterized protein n=1 Tax=Cymbomonas tetramitiformis TaxID=36881 RepID=A0AAE0GS41_9CHLO|nr:hypothetical protein CYMTET_8886 [Cymbomonas tetramitiformis]|eukprot:gene2849-3648_t